MDVLLNAVNDVPSAATIYIITCILRSISNSSLIRLFDFHTCNLCLLRSNI